MSVSGGCEICHAGDVSETCRRCGNLVCDRHFDYEFDCCVECASELGGRGDSERSGERSQPDGVDTYRF